MKTAIVVDASLQTGVGHLMRCITLGIEIRKNKSRVVFFCHHLIDSAQSLLKEYDFEFFIYDTAHPIFLGEKIHSVFNGKVDWIIFDNYQIDYSFEHQLRRFTHKIFIIDDLANRKHDADILLDQNYYPDMQTRYHQLVPTQCKLLAGPNYVLLRDQFYHARKSLRARSSSIHRIFLFYSGTDPGGHTVSALTTLINLVDETIFIDVVVGSGNPQKEQIESLCQSHQNIHFHCPAENIVTLMLNADLAVGSGGTAMWERAFLGLPSIVQIIAKNQFETTNATGQLGVIYNIGWGDQKYLSDAILQCINNPNIMREMISSCFKLFPDADNCGKKLIVDQMNACRL